MISIVIPTLNEEKLLPQLLDQIFVAHNEAPPFEVVLSDGGSTDATLDIARSYPVRIVEDPGEKRQTIAEGRNAGARHAVGDILVFVNADILFDNLVQFLNTVDHAFHRGDRIAGATCLVEVFPDEEKLSDKLFHFAHNGYVRFLNAIGEGMGRGECQVLRRDLFERIGGYNGTMVAGEDYDLFRRVRKHGKVIMLPDIVIYESPRRFRKYGYTRIVWGWIVNAVSVIFKNKSSSDVWEPVR